MAAEKKKEEQTPSPQIPFLPGNTFVDPRKTDFRKQQTLKFHAGMAVSVAEPIGVGNEPHVGTTMRRPVAEEFADIAGNPEIDFTLTYGNRTRGAQKQPIPAHIALDKKVLAFKGYFTETENAETRETRVRFVRICFFLVDDTLSVWEERQQNSGIEGGMRVRRQKIQG